ncbi:MAG: hypothetical protein ACFB10_06450 [Salibacteraceae bacterium]
MNSKKEKESIKLTAKDRKTLEEMKEQQWKRVLRHPATIVVASTVGVFVFLYASSYLMEAAAKATRSYKLLRRSLASS